MLRCPVISLLVFTAFCFAQAPSEKAVSVPLDDAPELASRGSYPVGVRTVEITHPDQIDVLSFNKDTGQAPRYNRRLTVDVWYPAVISPGQRQETTYEMPVPGNGPYRGSTVFKIRDEALRDAPPVAGKQFPLVIVSHGYPGSRYFMTYLTANLASKGYVVASLDHTDSVFGQIKAFESTLLNRSNDQLFTIDALKKLSLEPTNFLHGLVDAANVGVVGYSMGGYGALTTAGAGLSSSSPLMQRVPGGYLKDWAADSTRFGSLDRSAVKAVVAIAPWGAQPPYRAWDAGGLAGIHIPALFIAGDQDDVSDYEKGIRPAFQQAVHSERCLLTYENARHNTGANAGPPDMPLTFGLIQAYEEPVWSKERIISINQHFITAFLDLFLKQDESKRSYLYLRPARSNDGKWLSPPASGERFSTGTDAAGNLYWKGFRRRWALGLEMSCLAAAPGE